jgi:hypothetical protein
MQWQEAEISSAPPSRAGDRVDAVGIVVLDQEKIYAKVFVQE